MERLAMLLATWVISLDTNAATRILWDVAKLYRASTSEEERKQLLQFQAEVCALVGRPAVVVEAEDQADDESEDLSGPSRSNQGVPDLGS